MYNVDFLMTLFICTRFQHYNYTSLSVKPNGLSSPPFMIYTKILGADCRNVSENLIFINVLESLTFKVVYVLKNT